MYTNFQLNFQAFSKKVNNLSSRYLHHLLYEMYVPDPSNRVLEDDIISFYGISTDTGLANSVIVVAWTESPFGCSPNVSAIPQRRISQKL